jgi:hypothetical protein
VDAEGQVQLIRLSGRQYDGSIIHHLAKLPAAKKSVRKKRVKRRRRAGGGKSLGDYVTEILGDSKSGLTLQEFTNAVLAAGYQTTSANFKQNVYQYLHHSGEARRDAKSKTYRLK